MEVEVDTETGPVDIIKVVTVNDVGKVINWDGCEGQAYGGAIMAIGRGMTEEMVCDPRTGVMLNGNLLNYKIPTMMDYGDIETIMVETGMGYGPYGSIGIGEDVATVLPALIGPAVQNAIGVWIDDLPHNTGPGARSARQGVMPSPGLRGDSMKPVQARHRPRPSKKRPPSSRSTAARPASSPAAPTCWAR